MRIVKLFGQSQEPYICACGLNKIKLYRPEEALISSGETLVQGIIFKD
jgi:hypothetical protein